mmetsp:Transcript_25447/g.64715  ORF Transcript_25447/g.64715 Transcript_25447/m.64715 type:complete len:255 (+) Transcript_25447:261-1025(+)
MGDLDAAEGLQYSDDVLLQQRLVQVAQVVRDDRILVDLRVVLLAHGFEFLERPRLVGACDGRHGVDRRAAVLQAALAANDHLRLLRSADHDLGQQHVLHRGPRLLHAVGRVEGLVRLVEVGVGGAEVLLPRGHDAGPGVDLRLQQRRAVDGVGVGLGRREAGLALRHVLQRVVRAALDEVDLDQEKLVVHLLHLDQQAGQQRQRLLELRGLQQQPREPRLDALPQEGALLALAPLDAVPAHLDLQGLGVRRLGH